MFTASFIFDFLVQHNQSMELANTGIADSTTTINESNSIEGAKKTKNVQKIIIKPCTCERMYQQIL